MNRVSLHSTIPDELAGKRLDQAAAILFKDYSRAQLQAWIKAGKLKLDGEVCTKTREAVKADSTIGIDTEVEIQGDWQAEAIPLNIIFEDDAILVINKPAGLVVHPGAGNPQGTLVNALLNHLPQLNQLPRAGIVHRLDKETTGLLVIAKSLVAHSHLVKALQQREVTREYEAIVVGQMISGGTVNAPMGRHPSRRTAMAVVHSGKEAISHYRIATRYPCHTHLRIKLETGRTHQIRVHMAHINHPLVGDPVYGKKQIPAKLSPALRETLSQFNRQALHAARLELNHPISGEWMSFTSPLPIDMQRLIAALTEDANRS